MVETWRSPKAENSAERMPSIETPSVLAPVAVDLQRRPAARAAANRW
jgi:hypothetical protein